MDEKQSEGYQCSTFDEIIVADLSRKAKKFNENLFIYAASSLLLRYPQTVLT